MGFAMTGVAEASALNPFGAPLAAGMLHLDAVSSGLPMAALEQLCRQLAPDDRTFKYRFVSKATYARRMAAAPPGMATLSKSESERLARMINLWSLAVDAWGSETSARRFLREPHMLLRGRAGLDVALDSEQGARMVEDILGRLIHGTGV